MAAGAEVAAGRSFPRLHWGAVIAGVLVAIAGHVVLGLVGAALGLAAEPANSTALGVGAAIWALVTPFVATLIGAWLACRMASAQESRSATLHGILVWCIGLIAGALFLTGTMASGAMTAGTAASGNLGPAQRMTGREPRADAVRSEARTDDVAAAAGAAAGGAALAAIAGLLGAVAGAGLASRRSSGRGLGWRIAIQRQDERRAGGSITGERLHDRAYAPPVAGAEPRHAGSAAPEPGSPTDPYHH
jgi:hypothetical protein